MRNWRRALTIVSIISALSLPAFGAYAGGYSAVVIDAGSKKILHAENIDDPRYPASLTKIMTLYMTFDALKSGKLRIDQPLSVSAYASGQAPSNIGLRPGETISVRNAILATVTKSANDAAVVLAEGMAATEADFAKAMTARARALGMTRTTFRNASGLPNPAQKTTARDMATLAMAMLKNHREQYHFFSTESFTWRDRAYNNHNHLLGEYDGADGIKTGFIRASGFNLVASAKRDGRRLVGVVFGGATISARDNRMMQLLDKGFARPEPRQSDLLVAQNDEADEETLAPAAAMAEDDESESVSAPIAKKTAKAKKKPEPRMVANTVANEDPPVVRRSAKQGGTKSGGKSGDWGVQVGAFSQMNKAEEHIRTVLAALPNSFQSRETAITPAKAERSTIYRARLLGLDELDAKTACQQLKKRGHPCAVLNPRTAGL